MKLLPEHVGAARGILKMTRGELAKITGITEATIWNFEKGETEPREETLWRIQTAFEQRGIIFHNGGTPGVTLDRSKAIVPAK